jgi:hypothetical protein
MTSPKFVPKFRKCERLILQEIARRGKQGATSPELADAFTRGPHGEKTEAHVYSLGGIANALQILKRFGFVKPKGLLRKWHGEGGGRNGYVVYVIGPCKS